MLNNVAEFMAATLAKPDPRAWDQLLVYCPKPDEDKVAWAILDALHADLPVEDRPHSWSDLNDQHERKIRRAAQAAIAALSQS
jgi:hypothetical protein